MGSAKCSVCDGESRCAERLTCLVTVCGAYVISNRMEGELYTGVVKGVKGPVYISERKR